MMSFLLLKPGIYAPLKKERGYSFMEEGNKSVQTDEKGDSKGKPWWDISKPMLALICTIGGILLSLVITLGLSNFYTLPVQVENFGDRVEDLSENLKSFSEEMRETVKELGNTDAAFWEELYEIKASANGTIINAAASQEFSYEVSRTLNAPDLPGKAPVVQLLSNTVVARSSESGQELKVSDLANHKILLPYESGGQEVVFYGYINENGRWDGNCIINTYRDNKLELITDAIYLNGKLLSCKQVFYYKMSSEKIVWAYADRLSEESFSTGETWLYAKEDDYFKDFDLSSATEDDVLTADGFREIICGKKIAYYYGNTADGYFNDITGNAYMIHYFEDGSVKLLYSGNFVNGLCNDSTGNAWQIVREEDTKYMCYKGPFKNNQANYTKRVRSFPSPLSSLEPDRLEEFWDCWNDSSVLVYLGNSMSREDIDLIIGDRKFDGDGVLDWGYLDDITI